MHYRNGREAKNGDKVVKLEGGKIVAFGVLHSATPGNDYCNGTSRWSSRRTRAPAWWTACTSTTWRPFWRTASSTVVPRGADLHLREPRRSGSGSTGALLWHRSLYAVAVT
jgi:hypothetical protein